MDAWHGWMDGIDEWMDGYLTQNQFRNTCQSVISVRTDWMVEFLTPVRNIASDYKMVTEMKQNEKNCVIEFNPKHKGLLGT